MCFTMPIFTQLTVQESKADDPTALQSHLIRSFHVFFILKFWYTILNITLNNKIENGSHREP